MLGQNKSYNISPNVIFPTRLTTPVVGPSYCFRAIELDNGFLRFYNRSMVDNDRHVSVCICMCVNFPRVLRIEGTFIKKSAIKSEFYSDVKKSK